MQLLKLRYFQIRRDLGYWVLVIAVFAFFVAGAFAERSEKYTLYFVLALMFFFMNYHFQRKDLNFLRKFFERSARQIAMNYNLLVLPATIAFLFYQRWMPALLLHVFVSLLPFIKIKTTTMKLGFISDHIPSQHFEWISGVRRYFFIMIVLSLLAIVLSPVKLFGLGPLLLLNSIFLAFYNDLEPLLMLNPQDLQPQEFLKQKVGFITKMLLIFNLPVLILNSVLHPEVLWFNAGFLVAFILLAAATVYIKYASYEPNGSISFSIDLLLLYAAVFVPFLLPISLIICFFTKKKAINNLLRFTE